MSLHFFTMVLATYLSLWNGLDQPSTDVMENIDPEKVPYMFRTDFKSVWYVDAT